MLFTVTRLHRNNMLKMGSALCPPHNSCIYIELLIHFFYQLYLIRTLGPAESRWLREENWIHQKSLLHKDCPGKWGSSVCFLFKKSRGTFISWALWTSQYHGSSGYYFFFPLSFSFLSYRLAGSEEEEEEGQWQLYFKLYCFLDIENVPKDGVEFAFMFEQVSWQWENDLVSRVAEVHQSIQKNGLALH